MGRKTTWNRELPPGFNLKHYERLAALNGSELANVLHLRLHALNQFYLSNMRGKRVLDLLRLPAEQRIDCVRKAAGATIDLDLMTADPLNLQGYGIQNTPGSQAGAAVRDLQLADLNGAALLFTYIPQKYHDAPHRTVKSLLADEDVFGATLDRVVQENSRACAQDICLRLKAYRDRVLNDHLLDCVVKLDRNADDIQSQFSEWLWEKRREAQVRSAAQLSYLRSAIITNQIVKIVDLGLLVGPYHGYGYSLAALARHAGLSRTDRFAEMAELLDCCINLAQQGLLIRAAEEKAVFDAKQEAKKKAAEEKAAKEQRDKASGAADGGSA